MKIVFTRHASVDKVAMLKKHKFIIYKNLIKDVIKNPEDEDKESDFPKIIASKAIDSKHVLRIVYKRSFSTSKRSFSTSKRSLRSSTSSAGLKRKGDIITVITFYPARKGRYF